MATPQLGFHTLLQGAARTPDRAMVAVSGGIDSVALLHALVEVGRRPLVVYFNHGWRLEASEEARGVRALARRYGLRFCGGRATGAIVKTESEARRQRMIFFARAGRRFGLGDVLLAHHADDQVETCLLQLFRGASGIVGMRETSERLDLGLTLHRPWLSEWKETIRAYASHKSLKWWEDASNEDARFRRNQLRLQVVPFLTEQWGAEWKNHLLHAAQIGEAEREWMDDLCRAEAGQSALGVVELKKHPLARQRRTVALWLRNHQVKDIGFAVIEAVVGLLYSIKPSRVNLSESRWVRRRAGKIFLQAGSEPARFAND